jgi:hypothetical protein
MQDVRDLLRAIYITEEHHDQVEGSCQWIEDREDYRTWMGAGSKGKIMRIYRPSIFWVQAHPGAGKTVLLTHVAAQLSHFQLPQASHFFHFGKKSAQTLASMLRSIALQMAHNNAAIREKLASVYAVGSLFDRDHARAVWQKVFVGGIFQVHKPYLHSQLLKLLTLTSLGLRARAAVLGHRCAGRMCQVLRTLHTIEGRAMSFSSSDIHD